MVIDLREKWGEGSSLAGLSKLTDDYLKRGELPVEILMTPEQASYYLTLMTPSYLLWSQDKVFFRGIKISRVI